MTRKHGTCVLIGPPPGEFPVPLFDVVANCITIRGSFLGTRQDMVERWVDAAGERARFRSRILPPYMQPLAESGRIVGR